MNRPSFQLAGATDAPPTTSSYWVVPKLLLAGTYPGDRNPVARRQKIESLMAAGVRTFVNLMEADETNHDGQPFAPYRDLAVESCPGATFFNRPIKDLGTPSISEMTAILDAIDDSLNNARPSYVHCWGGVGRTGTVIGCWLLRQGLAEPANVLAVLQRLREQDQERRHRRSPETDAQCRFVTDWLKNAGPSATF